MDTRNKLEEARYFLQKLRESEGNPNLFNYNLSAFLAAWRSVLDIMLSDFAEHYSLGFTREDKLTDEYFEVAAKAINNNDALRFIRWWRQKQGLLRQNPLWKKRTIVVHRGYPPTQQSIRFYVSGSGGTSNTITVTTGYEASGPLPSGAIPTAQAITTAATTTPIEVRFSDFPGESVIDKCTRAINEIESVVGEAEKEFNVKL